MCQRRGGTLLYSLNTVFVSEKGWNFAIFMERCVCAREGVELCYIHGTLCLCQRRGGTLLYSWLCVGAREGVELWLYSCNTVFVPEEGWNAGYIYGTAYHSSEL